MVAIIVTLYHASEKFELGKYFYCGIYLAIALVLIIANILHIRNHKNIDQVEVVLNVVEAALTLYFAILGIQHYIAKGHPLYAVILFSALIGFNFFFISILGPRSKYLAHKGLLPKWLTS